MFSACSKQEQPKEFSPTGKTYAAFAYKSVISNSDIYDVYRFTSKTQVEYTGREGSPSGRIMGSPETYTYTLAYPSMTMHNSSGQLLLPFTFISESTFRMTDSRGITYEYNLQ
ncbi:MAG: hypothetical protein A2X18_07450 [Bacteroidetes bacterium GWF2_40_14]|nr:MAG: hypothetical protein A2X18_07450 [Bacteroidetes bacterium GWF2_40_14]